MQRGKRGKVGKGRREGGDPYVPDLLGGDEKGGDGGGHRGSEHAL
jgi:hypothetical protein